MMMCFASWSFCPLKNRIKSFVRVWSICPCWSGFSHIHPRADLWQRNGRFQGPEFIGSLNVHSSHFGDILAAEWLAVHVVSKLIIVGSISALDTLWDAFWGVPRKQKQLPCSASCSCSSTRWGSFPFRDALLFPAVAGRGAFQEGDEEARLNALKSGFIIFFFYFAKEGLGVVSL